MVIMYSHSVSRVFEGLIPYFLFLISVSDSCSCSCFCSCSCSWFTVEPFFTQFQSILQHNPQLLAEMRLNLRDVWQRYASSRHQQLDHTIRTILMRLVTYNDDFENFKSIRWMNPIILSTISHGNSFHLIPSHSPMEYSSRLHINKIWKSKKERN